MGQIWKSSYDHQSIVYAAIQPKNKKDVQKTIEPSY